MQSHQLSNWIFVVALLQFAVPLAAQDRFIVESARDLPIAYEVDVAIVGGTTGAVQAAISAAEKGAKVFLATPRSYLGDDITASLQLWLEDGEEPESELGKKIYAASAGRAMIKNSLPFKYQTSLKASSKHPDRGLKLLTDGRWHDAPTESIQYDGSVEIIADLGKVRPIRKTHVLAYQRTEEFEVASAKTSWSVDGKTWHTVADTINPKLAAGGFEESCIDIETAFEAVARFVKFEVQKTDRVTRMLLGEIAIEGPDTGKSTEDKKPPRPMPTPLHVKRTLDDALISAGVNFLFWCYTTDLLKDENGRVAGIVITNRGGRQAIIAKTVIDATPRARLARTAGATGDSNPAGIRTFNRVVIGGEPVEDTSKVTSRIIPPSFHKSGRAYSVIEYTLKLPLKNGSLGAWAEADQIARDLTWHPDQQFTSEELIEVPPDAVRCRSAYQGEDDIPIDAFRPRGLTGLYVLGGCADVSRKLAGKLARPLELMRVGERIGAAAAAESASLEKPKGVTVAGQPDQPGELEVRESLMGIRPNQDLPTLPQPSRRIPVLAEYDVVVIGGGTSGCPAGIGAARQGMKTLVVEYQYGLGGVGTMGAISGYWYGYRKGFTMEVLGGKGRWGIEEKMEWWRRALREAGADVWFGSLGCGAVVDKNNQVKGVLVSTPYGRGVVLAKVVIDSTGNSDIAAAAGAETIFVDGADLAMQGTGLPPRELGASYANTDFTFSDETDMIDVWNLFISVRKQHRSFDSGKFIDTRERRRIVGDYTLKVVDFMNEREYPDSIVRSRTNFDTHGFTIDKLFTLKTPSKKRTIFTYTPYRCLLPRGFEGILVTGLGTSAHRDVVPVIRMQADLQNEGYAAGVAAAFAVKDRVPLRKIDIRKLQKHLIEIEALPEEVLYAIDTFPMPEERVQEAVLQVKNNYEGAAVLLAQPKQAIPLLKEAWQDSPDDSDEQLIYAQVLGILGDSTGIETLIEKVKSFDKWDTGWNFKGMGQFGNSMSRLDSFIYSLGFTKSSKALPPILEKMKTLDATQAFSHHRAVSRALEMIGDKSAAPALAAVLRKPDMISENTRTLDRGIALRELTLARALFRCGDHEGLGRQILEKFTKDTRGHFARHAWAILNTEE